jgi:Protein of unknown function (DUF3060)
MDPQDDPEARIRDLERPLSDMARTSEMGAAQPGAYAYPPTLPPITYGPYPTAPPIKTASLRGWWIVLAVFAVGAIALAAGVAVVGAHLFSSRGSIVSSPSIRPSISRGNPSVTKSHAAGGSTAAAPPGGNLTVTGISQNRTIACNDSVVTVSGITNTVVLTGHCASLSVVGSQNVVTVDAADTIDASGIENQITFHSGSPNVQNSGISNVVQQG